VSAVQLPRCIGIEHMCVGGTERTGAQLHDKHVRVSPRLLLLLNLLPS
jgi:hypothetical protein